jgi:hypothetical protein
MQSKAITAKLRVRILRKLVRLWAIKVSCFARRSSPDKTHYQKRRFESRVRSNHLNVIVAKLEAALRSIGTPRHSSPPARGQVSRLTWVHPDDEVENNSTALFRLV